MKNVKMLALALAALLALAACAETDADLGADTTLAGGVTTLPGDGTTPGDTDDDDLGAAVDEVRDEIEELGNEIESSEAADDLMTEWTALRTEIEEAITAAASGSEFDTSGLESAMDDFQADLEAAGDELDDELMSAWTALRTQIEQLVG